MEIEGGETHGRTICQVPVVYIRLFNRKAKHSFAGFSLMRASTYIFGVKDKDANQNTMMTAAGIIIDLQNLTTGTLGDIEASARLSC